MCIYSCYYCKTDFDFAQYHSWQQCYLVDSNPSLDYFWMSLYITCSCQYELDHRLVTWPGCTAPLVSLGTMVVMVTGVRPAIGGLPIRSSVIVSLGKILHPYCLLVVLRGSSGAGPWQPRLWQCYSGQQWLLCMCVWMGEWLKIL